MRLIVALALLFAVTPGMTEVAESVAHAIGHGDLPHHEDADTDPLGCDEHTCTPLFHACGCHASMSAQASGTTAYPASARDGMAQNVLALVASLGRATEPPPLRPPIAA